MILTMDWLGVNVCREELDLHLRKHTTMQQAYYAADWHELLLMLTHASAYNDPVEGQVGVRYALAVLGEILSESMTGPDKTLVFNMCRSLNRGEFLQSADDTKKLWRAYMRRPWTFNKEVVRLTTGWCARAEAYANHCASTENAYAPMQRELDAARVAVLELCSDRTPVRVLWRKSLLCHSLRRHGANTIRNHMCSVPTGFRSDPNQRAPFTRTEQP